MEARAPTDRNFAGARTAFPWARIREHNLGDREVKVITINTGSRGQRLKKPVSATIPADLSRAEEAVVNYIIESMVTKEPRLIHSPWRTGAFSRWQNSC